MSRGVEFIPGPWFEVAGTAMLGRLSANPDLSATPASESRSGEMTLGCRSGPLLPRRAGR